jgi:PPOX class probable F420-dependent enzyme
MQPTPEQEKIIQGEKLAIMSTLRRDGSAQLTPINYAFEDGRFLISTTRDRAKYHNVMRNPHVSLCIITPEWRPYVSVFGRAEVVEDDIVPGTAAIMRKMGREAPDDLGELLRQQKRVLIVLTPERFAP